MLVFDCKYIIKNWLKVYCHYDHLTIYILVLLLYHKENFWSQMALEHFIVISQKRLKLLQIITLFIKTLFEKLKRI